jgi:hypothetical protein
MARKLGLARRLHQNSFANGKAIMVMSQNAGDQNHASLFHSGGRTMKRFILTVAAVAFTAILTNVADVQGSGKSSGSHNHGSSHYAHSNHYGRYFGRDYRNWSRYCWFPRYNCYGYCCPSDGCWYYWCDGQGRYIPTSEMASYPPTTSGFAPTGPGATGSLPPGATLLPANPK